MTHPISEKKLDVAALLVRLETSASQSELGRNLAGTPQNCRAAAAHITALTKKVDELEAALRSAGVFSVKQMMGLAADCNDKADRIALLEDALRGVIAVADRKTVEFDRARTALNDTTQCRESDNG